MTDAERIAVRIGALRKEREMTLQQVADRAGLSKSHVWEVERGRHRNPTLSMLRAMADCFGISMAYLIGDDVSVARLHPEAMAIAVRVDEAIRRAALPAPPAAEGGGE